MSANPRPPVRALAGHSLRPMTLASLDGVVALEAEVYPFPWTRGNFVDSIAAGYIAWTLNGSGGELLAYCVAMRGAGEMHLLNITVAAAARRRGHARRLLDALVAECRDQDAERLWLEVRLANVDAQQTYARLGFIKVGVRKGYYPAPAGTREDAVVMSKIIEPAAGEADALE
ncbi:MAG: ribosomal protein S18-alanine N-acetyltransferase [Burkholderiales bacterium]|nr:ribosomal protein S18-alanine N-acetyltransferase [Burkholderiales bacterium]